MALLSTRFFRPPILREHLSRNRLISKLEANKGKSAIFIIAAAGYGKSILVSQWLQVSSVKSGWLSLESDSNNFEIFLDYLTNTVQREIPNSMKASADMLGSLHMPPYDVVLNTLIDDLNALPQEFRLILDDYHNIQDQNANSLIYDLIRIQHSKLKIVIISRYDPPFKVGSLLAYGNAFELRAYDLKFSEEEILDYSEGLAIQASKSQIESIHKISEGWAVGVRLLVREVSLSNTVPGGGPPLAFEKDHLRNYLKEELFLKLPVDLRHVLMISSLNTRFNLELLTRLYPFSKVLANTDPQDINNRFVQFIKSSLFIIPLDDESRWYRFHHLIKEFLYMRLKEHFTLSEINDMLLAASSYFENNNFLEEAITCALEGQNLPEAIEIILRNWDELLLHDQYGRLGRWLQMLPAGASEGFPKLLLINTTLNDAHANYREIKRNLDKFESMMEPLNMQSIVSKKLWGGFHALRAGLGFFSGDYDSIQEHADQALSLLAGMKSYFNVYALLMKGLHLQISGQGARAVDLFLESQSLIDPNNRLELMRSQSFLALIHIYQGNLNAIKGPAKLTLKISREEKSWVAYVMSIGFLEAVYYLQNDLDKVKTYIDLVSEHRMGGRPNWVAQTLLYGVFYYRATSQYEKMEQAAGELSGFLKSFGLDNYTDFAYSIEVELAIGQNNLKLAEESAAKTNFDSVPIVFSFYYTQLTKVKLLLLKGDNHSMDKAFDLLTKYVAYGKLTHNSNFLIQVFALLALWYQQRADMDKALENLRQSLGLARQGGYIRTYLDFGPAMHAVFGQLSDQERSEEYISRIVRAFEEESEQKKLPFSENVASQEKEGVHLKPKEIEILLCVSQGLQNKEIADRLFLSDETVKKYLYYIYAKLDVGNRTAAIAKALQLNLIPLPKSES